MNTDVVISYQHPVVRDLAWVMVSPGLLRAAPEGQTLVTDDWCRHIYATHENHLRELDEDPAPLLNALSKNKNHRLGIYFECLLRYWLQSMLYVQELQHNVPVFQSQKTGGKRTLGEFDFLFRVDEKQPVQHWETTVKFYLQKRDSEGKPCWIGPGDQDRFDIKLGRLFQHQLALANFPEAKEYLIHMGAGLIQPAAFIKGYLFYPRDDAGEFFSGQLSGPVNAVALAPCTLSENHLKGWWLHWRKTPVPATVTDARWVILSKLRWLSPVCHAPTETTLLDKDALTAYCETHFRQRNNPLLVAELAWQSTVWLEISRGFVLAPD